VDPHNPDAILAEIMPRRNWGDVGLGGTEDMGLIFVDVDRHEILFEGDNKRYRIPAASFLSAEVEMVNPDWEGEPGSAPVAVVTVKYRESGALGEREIPFRPMLPVPSSVLLLPSMTVTPGGSGLPNTRPRCESCTSSDMLLS